MNPNDDPMKTINTAREFNPASLKSRMSLIIKHSTRKPRNGNNTYSSEGKPKRRFDIFSHNNLIESKLTDTNILTYLNTINHTKEMDKTLHTLKMLKRSVEKTKSPIPPIPQSKPLLPFSNTTSTSHNTIKNTFYTKNKTVYDIIPITKIQDKGTCSLLPQINNDSKNDSICDDDIYEQIEYEPNRIQTEVQQRLTTKTPMVFNTKHKVKRTKDNKVMTLNFLLDTTDSSVNGSGNINQGEYSYNGKGKSLYYKSIRVKPCKVSLHKVDYFADTLGDCDRKRQRYQYKQEVKHKMLNTAFPRQMYHRNFLFANNSNNINKAHNDINQLEKEIFSYYDIMRDNVDKEKPHYI